jgi:hypothetical protein
MTLLALLVAAAVGASGASPEEKSIDSPCDAAKSLDDAHKLKPRVFGDVSENVLPKANDGRGTWRAFKSDDDLKAYAQKESAPNTQAWIWNAPDGTTFAQLYFASDSGDWADDVDYCFRADGSLARVVAALVNVTEGTNGRRDLYYGRDGGVLAKRERSFDERTKKKLPKEHTGNVVLIYPTVASLPFLQGPPAPPKGAATPTPPARAPDGELDPELVARFVRARLPEIKGCYESELAKKPTLSGKVTMTWTIKVDGTVGGVGVADDTLGAPAVASCLKARVSAWRFPPPVGGSIDVNFPFVFQTPGVGATRRP